MVMLLLQQIGLATATRRSFSARAAGLGSIFARRGKSALVPPPAPPAASFSRLYSNGAPGYIEDEPFFVYFCKLTFMHGATLGLMYGIFDWVDYGGYKYALITSAKQQLQSGINLKQKKLKRGWLSNKFWRN